MRDCTPAESSGEARERDRFRALRAVLAELYPTVLDQRRVVTEAGLRPAAITFDAKAENSWFEILAHASHQCAVDAVVAVARREFPRDVRLAFVTSAPVVVPSRLARTLTSEDRHGFLASMERLFGDEAAVRALAGVLGDGAWLEPAWRADGWGEVWRRLWNGDADVGPLVAEGLRVDPGDPALRRLAGRG